MSDQDNACVRFSRNSWHRRLVGYVWGNKYLQYVDFTTKLDDAGVASTKKEMRDKYISLCPYIRRVILGSMVFPFMAIWKSLPETIRYYKDLIHVEIIYAFLCLTAHILINLRPEWVEAGAGWALPIGFFGGNALGILGFFAIAGVMRIKDHIDNRPQKEHRTRGLVKEYMEAKHNKICPCVEFVD